MKRCTKCEIEKPISEFSVERRSKDGLQAYCNPCKNDALNKWRKKNLDKCRAYERKWYKEHPTKKRTYWLRCRARHPESYLWKAAKQRATEDGLYFTITPEDIKIPVMCPVLCIPLSFGATRKEDRSHSPSVDRIDPKLGYVPGNIVVMSYKANTMKSNANLAELEALVAWLKKSRT